MAAVRGNGVVRFADYYMRKELSCGELESILEEVEVKDAATWIVYADRHHLPTRVRFLIDFLVERLRAMDQEQWLPECWNIPGRPKIGHSILMAQCI